jgi:hypothetical protein
MSKEDFMAKYELKDSVFWRFEEEGKEKVYDRYPENL